MGNEEFTLRNNVTLLDLNNGMTEVSCIYNNEQWSFDITNEFAHIFFEPVELGEE